MLFIVQKNDLNFKSFWLLVMVYLASFNSCSCLSYITIVFDFSASSDIKEEKKDYACEHWILKTPKEEQLGKLNL